MMAGRAAKQERSCNKNEGMNELDGKGRQAGEGRGQRNSRCCGGSGQPGVSESTLLVAGLPFIRPTGSTCSNLLREQA